MKFFSGFGFQNEASLFEGILYQREYSVAGFSFGAINAFEYVWESKQRIDTLQLLSPAFFQNRDVRFKRLQKMGYKKDSSNYMKTFYSHVCGETPVSIDIFKTATSSYDLECLLEYVWNEKRLIELERRGTQIEIYLGGQDKIIDASVAHEFFRHFGISWLFKESGHLLDNFHLI